MVDALGHRVAYQYDGQSNEVQVTAPSGSTRRLLDCNAFNQPGKVVDARGNVFA